MESKYRSSPKKIKTEEKNPTQPEKTIQNTSLSFFFNNITLKYLYLAIIPHETLDKILKHLKNPQKAPKALGLILQLLEANIQEIHPKHLLEVLLKISIFFNDVFNKKIDDFPNC